MQLEFFGAAGEVTGSCHILRAGRSTVLLDCGLLQGGDKPHARNREEFPFDAAAVDAVILSHAHVDHCGRLPLLRQRGFRGPIYATAACRDLARILLADSANLAERDAERENRRRAREKRKPPVEPLYTVEDAERTLRQFRTVAYGRAITVVPGVELVFRDAGHILGSASVWLSLEEDGKRCRLLFSGDLGQYDSPILRDPDPNGSADLVLMESTYGDRLHREREETLAELGDILRTARAGGGNVLIPAFAVGRSQELLYELATHYDDWDLANWRIFLDSPMAIEATAVYWQHADLYDEEAARYRQRAHALPPLPNLQLCRTAEESMAVNRIREGAIVIAGSGMCTGGRIVHHLKHNLPRPESHVVFTGFQARSTMGRALVDGAGSVRIYGEEVGVAAQIHTLGGFSAHGDQRDLLRWYAGVAGQPPVWLVHGEPSAAESLREVMREEGVRCEIAQPGLQLDLGANT